MPRRSRAAADRIGRSRTAADRISRSRATANGVIRVNMSRMMNCLMHHALRCQREHGAAAHSSRTAAKESSGEKYGGCSDHLTHFFLLPFSPGGRLEALTVVRIY